MSPKGIKKKRGAAGVGPTRGGHQPAATPMAKSESRSSGGGLLNRFGHHRGSSSTPPAKRIRPKAALDTEEAEDDRFDEGEFAAAFPDDTETEDRTVAIEDITDNYDEGEGEEEESPPASEEDEGSETAPAKAAPKVAAAPARHELHVGVTAAAGDPATEKTLAKHKAIVCECCAGTSKEPSAPHCRTCACANHPESSVSLHVCAYRSGSLCTQVLDTPAHTLPDTSAIQAVLGSWSSACGPVTLCLYFPRRFHFGVAYTPLSCSLSPIHLTLKVRT